MVPKTAKIIPLKQPVVAAAPSQVIINLKEIVDRRHQKNIDEVDDFMKTLRNGRNLIKNIRALYKQLAESDRSNKKIYDTKYNIYKNKEEGYKSLIAELENIHKNLRVEHNYIEALIKPDEKTTNKEREDALGDVIEYEDKIMLSIADNYSSRIFQKIDESQEFRIIVEELEDKLAEHITVKDENKTMLSEEERKTQELFELENKIKLLNYEYKKKTSGKHEEIGAKIRELRKQISTRKQN